MSDDRSSNDYVELSRTQEIQEWEDAKGQLRKRVLAYLVVISVILGFVLLTASHYMGWFQYPEVTSEVRTAFLIGVLDALLVLGLASGTVWLIIHRRQKVRVSRRRGT